MPQYSLIVFLANLKVCLRMLANRAKLGRGYADNDMPTVAAFPNSHAGFLEYSLCFYILFTKNLDYTRVYMYNININNLRRENMNTEEKNAKKGFEAPVAEVILFDAEDVITSSDPYDDIGEWIQNDN